MKKVIGNTNQSVLVAAVCTFLASAIMLLVLPEQRILLLVLLGSGLGSVFFFAVEMVLEYALGWEW